MTTNPIKTTKAEVECQLIDAKLLGSFRAFGTYIGKANTPEAGELSVYAFGDVIEIHDSKGNHVEFSIKGVMGEAHKLLTLYQAGKLDEYDNHEKTA